MGWTDLFHRREVVKAVHSGESEESIIRKAMAAKQLFDLELTEATLPSEHTGVIEPGASIYLRPLKLSKFGKSD